jgi:hypothetical protein
MDLAVIGVGPRGGEVVGEGCPLAQFPLSKVGFATLSVTVWVTLSLLPNSTLTEAAPFSETVKGLGLNAVLFLVEAP